MLEWLNEWLKSIIIIILLAAFVDLILPNRSMQRYVKVVVSLFVLMTILTPIVKMLVSDFDWDKLEFPNTPIDSIVASVTPLDQIERDGDRLRASQEQNALDIVKGQVEQMIAEQIEQTAGSPAQSVRAALKQNEDGEAVIERIDITFSMTHVNEGSSEDAVQQSEDDKRSNEALVNPVEPVKVDAVTGVKEHTDQTDNRDATNKAQASTEHKQMTELEQQIIRLLEREWELDQKQIRFVYIDNNAN